MSNFKNDYLIVSIEWSQTIQFGERKLIMPLFPIQGSILCPVKAYHEMCNHVVVGLNDPLFSLSKKSFITYSKFKT